MLEKLMADKVYTPSISPIAKGRAKYELSPDRLREYIDIRMRSIMGKTIYGLKYISIERCTAKEHVRYLLGKSEKEFDTTKSNMWLAKLTFEIRGERKVKYTFMPYITDDIFVNISGTPYVIVDVLTDKIISPGPYSVFIRFFKNKIKIISRAVNVVNNNRIRTTVMPYTEALNQRKVKSAPKLPLLWYLIVKYGFDETLKMIHGDDLMVIDKSEAYKYMDQPDKWSVYSTAYPDKVSTAPQVRSVHGDLIPGRRASKLGKFIMTYRFINGPDSINDRKGTDIYFVCKVEKDSDLIMQTVGSLYSVLDLIPGVTIEDLKDKEAIHRIVSIITYKDSKNTDLRILAHKLKDKLVTLEDHVDKYMQDLLYKEFGDSLGEDFSKDGFFKIMKVVYIRYKRWNEAGSYLVSNVLDKRFEILDYVTEPWFRIINTLSFSLTQSTLNKGVMPDANTVKGELDSKLTLGIMFSIRDTMAGCTRISYAGDNIYTKYTSTLHVQFNSTISTGNKARTTPGRHDAVTLLMESHFIVGTPPAVSKSRDTPLKYLNLFAQVNEDRYTVQAPRDQLERARPLERTLRKSTNRASLVRIPREFVNLGDQQDE